MPSLARAAVAAVLLTAGCAPGRAPPPSTRSVPMRVEADLFSGRPNPSFELDADQAAHLATLLRGLGPGGQAREAPGLGYRGFAIHGAEAALPGCGEVRAYHGAVTAECGGERRVLSDSARAVERWLLEAGRPHLEPAVFDAIRGELQP